jgi:hypothetical protein
MLAVILANQYIGVEVETKQHVLVLFLNNESLLVINFGVLFNSKSIATKVTKLNQHTIITSM